MDQLAHLNLEKVCRLCLSECENCLESHYISSEVETKTINLNIQELLRKIVDIKLSDTEELPNMVCGKCLQFLIKISNFLQLCLSSDKVIQNYYNELNNWKIEEEMVIIDVKHESSDDGNEDLSDEESSADKTQIASVEEKQKYGKDLKYYLQTLECGEKKYACNLCPLQFQYLDDFKEHIVTHGEEPFVCNDCRKSYRLYQHLNSHLRNSHKKKMTKNDKIMRKEKKLGSHFLETLENGEQIYACNLCEERFERLKELNLHLPSHGDKPYFCVDCKKGFRTSVLLNLHLKRHDNIPRFSCDLCDKRYKDRSFLVIHQRSHRGERPYLCSVCGKTFGSSTKLNIHFQCHAEDRKHICNHCGAQFKWSSSLTRHVLNHTSQLNYKCSECPKEFTDSSKLSRHKMIHTGLKPYVCTVCQKAFNRSSNLKTHIKSHMDVRAHVCEVCHKGFTQAHSLRTHFQIHTKEMSDGLEKIT